MGSAARCRKAFLVGQELCTAVRGLGLQYPSEITTPNLTFLAWRSTESGRRDTQAGYIVNRTLCCINRKGLTPGCRVAVRWWLVSTRVKARLREQERQRQQEIEKLRQVLACSELLLSHRLPLRQASFAIHMPAAGKRVYCTQHRWRCPWPEICN